ncbi:hypothetical protein [Bacillus tuaregi]|uniref:hypothetical protein n=1 Tax=Bacillus tuaregi TaxID=1816695 RepID=UPI0008F8650B|nr:hypothetical protein [Bacillus tuaregi]
MQIKSILLIVNLSLFLLAYSNQNLILGDWKPLEGKTGCGDTLTFTEDNIFKLSLEGQTIIEGTYQKVHQQTYFLQFFNGDHAEARVRLNDHHLLLVIKNDGQELCQCYKLIVTDDIPIK